jgi:hypothetical protein
MLTKVTPLKIRFASASRDAFSPMTFEIKRLKHAYENSSLIDRFVAQPVARVFLRAER